MIIRLFALVSGVVYVVVGFASFIPALSTVPAYLPHMQLDVSYGLFLGVFPQNIINKVALIVFGMLGIGASLSQRRSLERSILYARAVCLVMGAAAILGAIPATRTFFGFWPLWGSEAVLHGANALLGGVFGFLVPPTLPEYPRVRLAH